MRRHGENTPPQRGLIALCCIALLLTAGVEREAATFNRDGTKAFKEGRYEDASRLYSEALMRAPESESISYNLGAALHKTERFEDAAAAFARASRADDPDLRLKSLYNLGNTLFKMGNLAKAIEAYKRALDVDPTDFDTKVNLEKALKLLEEQEQQQDQDQQQQQQQQGEENQEGEEGQEGTSGGDQEQQQGGNEQQDEQGDRNQDGEQDGDPSGSEGEQEPSEQEQQQQPGAEEVAEGDLRYEEALRILEAMRDQEKELQKAKAEKLRARAKRGGKDW